MSGTALAQAASTFIGVRFKLYGRDRETGLDCVGLVCACLSAIGRPVEIPRGYRLRNLSIEQWLPSAAWLELEPSNKPERAGDVILVQPGPAQQHLMIVEQPGSVIHAHAGLRRVVRQPLAQSHTRLMQWRLTATSKDT